MRDIKLDNLKGILIVLVVFAHMLITYKYIEISEYNMIVKSIYFFHMPLFFLIAGELSKKVSLKRIKNYLILFLFMQASFMLYDYFIYGSFVFFSILYSSWFLLLLVLYRFIIYNKTIKKLFDLKYSMLITFIFIIIIGLLPLNLTVSRFFYFFIFFIFGYKCNIKITKNKSLILLPFVVLGILVISSITRLDLLMGDNYIYFGELFIRIIVIYIDILLYYSVKNIIIDKKIPFITQAGVSSLYIYVLHRIPTLLLSDYLYIYKGYILISLLISILLCLIIIVLSKYIEKIFQNNIFQVSILILLVCLLLSNIYYKSEFSVKEQSKFNNYTTIGFVGDLILLEDQLKNSNNNFDYMFDNMKNYFNNTDYMMSVLEGPVDDNNEYSYGNFDDSKDLMLNYPTSFLNTIKKSGIDLVSISNNHILDRGIISYKRTIENLNNYKFDYVGEKNNYKVINVNGLKIGVLAYSYGSNYKSDEFKSNFNYLVNPYSKEFKKVKNSIKSDFNKIKEKNVDLIVVLPHYGTQFSEKIDVYQEYYNRLFVDLGADIIFGDHAHMIQPIYYYKDSIIVNCVGNYINSYIKYNGDISMFVKVYIGKDKKIKGSSITPIIAEKNDKGLYYPVTMEMKSKKVKRAKSIISRVIFNKDLKEIKNTYYYLKSKNYKTNNLYQLELLDSDKQSLVYKKINEHNRICFVGDSITEGTKNNFHPWYEILMSFFNNKEVINISKGSFDTYDVINEFRDKIITSDCDLFIINIGTNDIRYNSRDVDEYIDNMKQIISYMNGEIIILSPWETTSRDYNISKDDKYKRKLYIIYNTQLKKLNNVYYVNPNNYIKRVIKHNGEYEYLIDGVHPNEREGIKLYSFSVLRN